MDKKSFSQLLLFFAGLNVTIGAAAAKLSINYLIDGLAIGAVFYCVRCIVDRSTARALK